MKLINSGLSFFIEYGWISGKAHGRKLTRLLSEQGYEQARSAEQADIVLTHSAGFYLLPSQSQVRLVFLVGPTLSALNFSNWLNANLENAKMFLRNGRILRGAWLNITHVLCIFSRPAHNLRIARAAKRGSQPLYPNCQIVLLANQHDPWPKPNDQDRFIAAHEWAYISMPGAHEHIWEQPEQYVEVINQYAKRLLA
jgi:hypothetical protein